MEHSRMSQSKQAYLAIKQDIIASRLLPGEKVTKGVLTERYGFGDAPLRDALARLSQENLVHVLPREGYIVAPITLQQIRELFIVRRVIEPEVARMAAGKVDAERLWQHESQVINKFDLNDRDALERYVRANSNFHLAIAQATGNARLVRVMEYLIDEMERIMLLSYLLGNRTTSTESGHVPLLEALVEGDGNRARLIMLTQLTDHQKFVEDAIVRSSGVLQQVNLAGDMASLG
jgi:DNA-binding GntR family transcriptional regulator